MATLLKFFEDEVNILSLVYIKSYEEEVSRNNFSQEKITAYPD